MRPIIAIDFDETITDNTPFPNMGKIRPEASKYIRQLYNLGYTLILWTCRTGSTLQDAIDYLNDVGLMQYFSYINRNNEDRPDRIKVVADFYIDDKSCLGPINWDEIYNYIINNIPLY